MPYKNEPCDVSNPADQILGELEFSKFYFFIYPFATLVNPVACHILLFTSDITKNGFRFSEISLSIAVFFYNDVTHEIQTILASKQTNKQKKR